MESRIRFVLPFLLFVLLVSLPAFAGPGRHIAIVVNMMENDPSPTDAEYELGRRQAQMSDLYPDSQIITISASSAEELKEDLARAVINPADQIDALVVDAHGGLFPRKGAPKSGPYNERFISYVGDHDGTFALDLLNEKSVKEALGPVIGRFAQGARVLFSSCNNAAFPSDPRTGKPDYDAIRKAMAYTARALRLSSGSLYLNRVFGSDSMGEMYLQPFQTKDTWGDKVHTLGAQLIAPVGVPIGLFADFIFNRGYVLETAGGKTRLRTGRFNEELMDFAPEGDLLASAENEYKPVDMGHIMQCTDDMCPLPVPGQSRDSSAAR
jgi:hypothetical protein